MPDFSSSSANYSNFYADAGQIVTAFRAGVTGEFLFGRDKSTSCINSGGILYPGVEQLAGAAVAPVYGNHQVELGNGAGIKTNVPASPAFTAMVITTVADTDRALDNTAPNQCLLIGADVADKSRVGLQIFGGQVQINMSGIGVTKAGFAPSGKANQFRALAMRVGGTGIATDPTSIDEFMGGSRTQSVSSTVGATRDAPNYIVTAGNSGTVAAGGNLYQSRVFQAGFFYCNRYVTDAELLAAYLNWRTFLAPWKDI